jgi:hypothetical protein
MIQLRTPGIGLNDSSRRARAASRLARAVLVLVILELTLATAYIHVGLGGLLFTLNAVGYLGLAIAFGATAAVPMLRRYGWLPRIGLAGYTMVTIGAYLIVGPYFDLGWIAKAIEVAIVGLVLVDLLGTYGTVPGLWRAAMASLPVIQRRGAISLHGGLDSRVR